MNVFEKTNRFLRTTAGKASAGAAALVASGSAMATSSPGSAIAGELAGGQTYVMLVVAAVAVILGLLILWAYVKRAK